MLVLAKRCFSFLWDGYTTLFVVWFDVYAWVGDGDEGVIDECVRVRVRPLQFLLGFSCCEPRPLLVLFLVVGRLCYCCCCRSGGRGVQMIKEGCFAGCFQPERTAV